MTANLRVFCYSEAMSPITHAARSEGNESVVMREPVVTDRGIAWVPVLSGNAIRHRCVREPGARWLVDSYGLSGKLSLKQLNYLFHGGNLTEGGGRDNLSRIADMQRLFPLTRLLGGCLPDQILSGSMHCWRGVLVCEENRVSLSNSLPRGWELPDHPLLPAETFVSGYQYTRMDSANGQADLVSPGERDETKNGKSNQMIFSGQAITKGAAFVHGFMLCNASDLELGALIRSLRLWQESGGTIGGQGSRGHGRLKTWVHIEEFENLTGAAEAYENHVESVADEAIDWLNEVFGDRNEVATKKPKKTKGGRQ